MKELTIFVCLILSSCFCVKLPPSFQKCNRKQNDFNQCLRRAIEDAIKQLNKPMPTIGLNSLDPLEVPFMTIEATNRFVEFQQNYINFIMYNFTSIHLSKIDMNIERKTMFMDCDFPELRWEFDYDFNGKLLSMRIKGKRPGSVTVGNINYKLTFTLDEYEKKGKRYFKVVGVNCEMKPGWIKVKLDNLFDGDEALGDNINKAINDNFLLLWDEVQVGYEPAFGQIFSTLFKSLLANVLIEELFGPE